MKENTHPKFEKTTIKCACGNEIETRSTKDNIRVEICSKCHPFFTGKQKLVDTSGRVGLSLKLTDGAHSCTVRIFYILARGDFYGIIPYGKTGNKRRIYRKTF